MAKRVDPKAKAKRQKIFAAVGGVILLGVLAIQVPRTMKMLNQEAPAPPPAAAPGTVPPSEPGSPSTPTAPAGAAVIAVNGAEETVQVGGEFPKDSPVFRLVKLTRTGAKIGIAGGALASGSPTV